MKLYHRYGCVGKKTAFVVCSVVSGMRWGSWNMFPVDKAALLYGVSVVKYQEQQG